MREKKEPTRKAGPPTPALSTYACGGEMGVAHGLPRCKSCGAFGEGESPASRERQTLRATFEARGGGALPLRFWRIVETMAAIARTPVEYSAPPEWDAARLAAEMAKDGHLFDSEKASFFRRPMFPPVSAKSGHRRSVP